MNTETENKPSKDMMDMVKIEMDKTYNLAIDHCIKTIKDIWDAEQIYYPMRQEMILHALSNLKNNK